MREIPEEWAPIEGFSSYKVSNHGYVMNTRLNHILKGRPNSYGHLRVTLSEDNLHKTFYLHRLVAQAFMGNYRGHTNIYHIDGDQNNCHLLNLRLKGGKSPGKMQHFPTNPQVRQVQNITTGEIFLNVAACARYLNTHPGAIYRVLRGERPSHLGYQFRYLEG